MTFDDEFTAAAEANHPKPPLWFIGADMAEPPESPQEPQSLLPAASDPEAGYFAASGPWERLTLRVVPDLHVRSVPQDIAARTILFRDEKQGIGIPCAVCRHRGTIRVGPRVYACQRNQCGAFSLVSIGRRGTDGFATYRCTPTSAEANEAARRLAQVYGRQEYEVRE